MHYADALKAQNPFGAALTGENLKTWNFGSLAQRLDPKSWTDIFFGRALTDTLGAPWVLLAAGVLVLLLRTPLRWALPALVLYITPFLVFTNLHIQHNYYQYANAAFALLAVAAAISGVAALRRHGGRWRYAPVAALVLLAGVVALQVGEFSRQFWPAIVADQSADRARAISARIAERTSDEGVAFVFGYDWNAIIAYMSGRRTVTVPDAIMQAHPDPTVWTGARAIDFVIDCDPLASVTAKPFVQRAAAGLKGYMLGECVAYDRVGPTGGEAALDLAVKPTFRADRDLQPLSLAALLASASDAGKQFAELIEEPGPTGPVPGVFAHLSTTLTIDAPAGAKELVVDYGIRAPAWANGGTTQGACFIVEGVNTGDAVKELWRACLRPLSEARDRGMHEASIPLPAGTRSLRFHTRPAVEGRTDWGWSYWANPRVR